MEKQIDLARKAGESEVERFQRRAEAEKADLKATISRLEVDLMKASYFRIRLLGVATSRS
jgi:hypothetical protein